MKAFFSLFSLILLGCGTPGPPSSNTMSNSEYMIIVQLHPDIKLDLKNGRFTESDRRDVAELNKIIQTNGIEVTAIESKVAQIANYQLYQLLTSGPSDQIIDRLRGLSNLVDGAYEKPAAEDAEDPF